MRDTDDLGRGGEALPVVFVEQADREAQWVEALREMFTEQELEALLLQLGRDDA